MSKYLVTGGAGFIASHIVEEVLRRGETVRVLDNFSTGNRENLKPFLSDIELIEGDIRNLAVVEKAAEGMDYIFHQAALPSVPRSINDPKTTNDVNISGTLNILIAAKNQGIKKVVYASSSSIYGNSQILPKKEDMPPNPLSPYAVSKLAGENYCRVFSNIYGLNVIVLRYFNVFGPKQDPTSQYSAVIPKFITMIFKGEQPTIYGDGTQSRDFTYVANVVHANLLCCNVDIPSGIFNVACGKRITVIDLVTEINRILGTNIKPTFAEPRRGEVKHSQADITKARELLCYEPVVSFQEGLRRTVEYFVQDYKL